MDRRPEPTRPAPADAPPVYGVMQTRDFLDCLYGAHRRSCFDLATAVVEGREGAVRESTVAGKPFCILRCFAPRAAASKPRVLVVAPLSGQFATLLRDTVAGLLPDHTVYITDWIDARQVPANAGKFDLDDNIAYVIDFIRLLGPEVHVLAVCQSAVPTLAAVSLLAAAGDPGQPRSMILMGGLIDARLNPTRVDRLAETLSLRWLERTVTTRVPRGFPGQDRRVYPAEAQRTGLLMYLARHIEYRPENPVELRVHSDATLADPWFCKELLTLMDLPVELYLQNIKTVLRDHALPRHAMTWRGQSVEPEAISKTALMTVEGQFDDISGRGQTHAAQVICSRIPPHKRRHYEQAGVGHFGMYAGASWFTSVLPQVCGFIRQA